MVVGGGGGDIEGDRETEGGTGPQKRGGHVKTFNFWVSRGQTSMGKGDRLFKSLMFLSWESSLCFPTVCFVLFCFKLTCESLFVLYKPCPYVECSCLHL